MTKRLEGLVAVVTGGGSGMGAGIAKAFVAEGARVVVADISGKQDSVAERLGEACVPVKADVSRSSDVQAMLETAIKRFGRLDVLCNNAGIEGALAPTGEYTEQEFDRVWNVNARGVFLGMRYGIPLMLSGEGGSIINTASIAATVGFETMPAYCASKGAVLMLTKVAALEYAAKRIRVNAICPGPIRTEMVAGLPAEYVGVIEKMVPAGRMGEVTEIASLAVYLASNESRFVTGTAVAIDGGYTAR
jgi:NAD(P)-dependent dehydrogenase (short-subunit alcohol dehydrogenase family)